uniref:Exonuclease mut-7 homolog n=1 Tax=Cacopsylla melanoneura TaxID=428564 RepID=A0A8D9A1M8_9HEMI
MNKSIKPTGRGRGRGWWNHGQGNTECAPGMIHNTGNSSQGGENISPRPKSLGRGEIMKKIVSQRHDKGTTVANSVNHVYTLDMQYSNSGIHSSPSPNSLNQKTNNYFTSPSVQSISNATFTSVQASCDSTSTNNYHNNHPNSSYQPADSSNSPSNTNVTHRNLSNSHIRHGTVSSSCDINTAATCDSVKPDSSSNSSYQHQVTSDSSTKHIHNDTDHKHNMYCSSVVCVTEVDKFVPEGHLLMLVKWIAHIINVWHIWKQSNFFSENLTNFFNTFPDPYSSTVYLLVEIPGEKSKNSKGLFLAVLNLFHSWIEPKKELKAHYLHYELKRILLKKWLLISCPDSLRKVRLAFQCDNEQGWIVNELLPTLKQNHKYREIRILAQEFELYSQVSIMDFLVPFVFQNKLVYVEESLKCYSQFQVPLLKYLDELLNCKNLDSRVKQIAKEQNIPEVKYDSLRYKPLSKLIMRLMKEFKIPQTACANVVGNKKKATLAFVVEKYYVAKSLNIESWREMALDIVKDNSNLQKELVEICVDHYDCKEAYYWCQKFKLNPNIPGFDLREKIVEEEQNQMPEMIWDSRQLEGYYSLSLPPEHIVLVDTCEKLALTLQYFARLNRNTCLGMDTEWKPNLSGASPASLALLQIATRERVYILDILSLSKLPKFNDLCLELELILFANDDLLKIGFNLMPDVNIIKTCLPFSESVSFNERSYLDLQLLWSKLLAETNIQFPYKEEHPVVGSQSLSTLVYKCFGKHLNKQDQFSNWENRPLRESQVQYAALDALCLVQVYDVLATLCAGQGLELVPLVGEVLSANVAAAKKATAKKKSKKKSMPPPPNKEPVAPQQVAFMCDVTLKSLARMLRHYGMDTTCAVSDNKECVAAIKQGEKRYLLTRGSGYGQLTCHVPAGHCLRIESATVPEQFEEVLSYYNVILPSNVEPRCEECNGAEFSYLDKVSALKLLELTRPTSTAQQHAHAQELGFDFDTSCRVNDPYDELDDYDEEDYDRDEDALPPPVNRVNTMTTTQQKLNPEFGYTKKKVGIKIDDVPLEVIEQRPFLHVCDDCGVIAL